LNKSAPLTRDVFIATLENLSLDAGGLKIWFTPDNHQGLHQVFLTKIENGKVVTIHRLK
jgi:hypothetical protein